MAWIVAVYNIPQEFDSFSLREFFDLKDALDMFHFKHRPESSLRQQVQNHFPNVHLEGGLPAPDTECRTSSTITVDFECLILGKRKELSSPSASSSAVLVAPPNTRSVFIKVKYEKLTAFTERYHRRPWQSRAPAAAAAPDEAAVGQCCFVTPLAREDCPSTTIPDFEEFNPPATLCRGNVGTSNSELVKLLSVGGLLSEVMVVKIQMRAPALWRWARQPPLPCPHSADDDEACDHIFAYNIPPHYLKKDLKAFFRQSIGAKSVCEMTYIGRPTSILLQFLRENFPHYLAPAPPCVLLEGDDCPGHVPTCVASDDRVSDHLDLYPFSTLSGGPKSCLLRVRSDHSQEFMDRYSGRDWEGGSTGSCYLVKIKQHDTGRLAFLSEYRHVRGRISGAPYSREPSFLGPFLDRLVPDAIRERLRVAHPELESKLQQLEQRAPSVVSHPDSLHEDPKNTLKHRRSRVQQYAAIPPPRSLQRPRRRRPPSQPPQTSLNSTTNLEKDWRGRDPNASDANINQNSFDETPTERNDDIRPPFITDPTVQDSAGSGAGRQTFQKNSRRLKKEDGNHMREGITDAVDTVDPLEQVFLGGIETKNSSNDGSNAIRGQTSKGEKTNTEKEKAWANLKRGQYRTKPSKKKKKFRAREVHMDSEGSEDGSDVEEWERSEAFRDTIEEKRSARERLYEEEIELVWEKGGSGLNFYTDEVYWRAQQGGFDERSTDEWDVDMQGYYGGVPGDYDAECRQDMDRMDRLRAGGDESCFAAPRAVEIRSQRHKRTRAKTEAFVAPCREGPDAARRRMLVNLRTDDEPEPPTKTARRKANKARRGPPPKVGLFEQHTRGIGRRLLEEKGWRDGLGLGRDKAGRPHAVPADGQRPWDKKGLGFEEPAPGWLPPPKPSSPPPGSPCSQPTDDTNRDTRHEEDEDDPFDRYKDVPIPKLLQHSVMMTKLFEKDFDTLFKGEDPDYEEDVVHVIRKMDTKRRKALKRHISDLKEEMTELEAKRVMFLKEYFVKADIESSGDDGCCAGGDNVLDQRTEQNGSGVLSVNVQQSDSQRKDENILDKHLQVLRGYGSEEEDRGEDL